MKIVKYPHPALRVQAQPILAIDGEIQKTAAGMLELMYASEGLGLAAPQVTLSIRLLVMNFAGDPDKKESEYLIRSVILYHNFELDKTCGYTARPKLTDVHMSGLAIAVSGVDRNRAQPQ